MIQDPGVDYLPRPDGERIAYLQRPGRGTGVVWLGGFKSDMSGTKAEALHDWADEDNRPFLRFDYYGHGESSGDFTKGSISRWREDAIAVLDELSEGPQILVGSSMGAWIALLAALARPAKVKGAALIAPALDFTEDLMWNQFPDEVKRTLDAGGVWERPSEYDEEPHPITKALIEDGRSHLLLRGPIGLNCPVRILHGMEDADVPWERSLTLVDLLSAEDVTATFVKDGDHRLSDDVNIARLVDMVEALAWEVDEDSDVAV